MKSEFSIEYRQLTDRKLDLVSKPRLGQKINDLSDSITFSLNLITNIFNSNYRLLLGYGNSKVFRPKVIKEDRGLYIESYINLNIKDIINSNKDMNNSNLLTYILNRLYKDHSFFTYLSEDDYKKVEKDILSSLYKKDDFILRFVCKVSHDVIISKEEVVTPFGKIIKDDEQYHLSYEDISKKVMFNNRDPLTRWIDLVGVKNSVKMEIFYIVDDEIYEEEEIVPFINLDQFMIPFKACKLSEIKSKYDKIKEPGYYIAFNLDNSKNRDYISFAKIDSSFLCEFTVGKLNNDEIMKSYLNDFFNNENSELYELSMQILAYVQSEKRKDKIIIDDDSLNRDKAILLSYVIAADIKSCLLYLNGVLFNSGKSCLKSEDLDFNDVESFDKVINNIMSYDNQQEISDSINKFLVDLGKPQANIGTLTDKNMKDIIKDIEDNIIGDTVLKVAKPLKKF